eukprot:SM000102S09181  [mRNA]  locus=s102:72549:73519:- [translate_table: standard]
MNASLRCCCGLQEWSAFFDQAELRPSRPTAPAAPSAEEPPSASHRVAADSLVVETAALDCAGSDEGGAADETAVSPAQQLDGGAVCELPDSEGQAVRDDEASCTEAVAADAAAAGEAASQRPAVEADTGAYCSPLPPTPTMSSPPQTVGVIRQRSSGRSSSSLVLQSPVPTALLTHAGLPEMLLGCFTDSLDTPPSLAAFAARYLEKDDRRPAGPDMQDCASTPMLSTPSLGLSPPATCQQLKPGRGDSSGSAESHCRLPSPFRTPGEHPGNLYSCQR